MKQETAHTNPSIAFIDSEVNPRSHKVLDVGGVKADGTQFHKASLFEFSQFLRGTQFICGHNILNHDIRYIGKALDRAGISSDNIIDTLFLSPLLFPGKPYHALVKDDKLQSEEMSNPLNDSIKARDLFYDEVTAFNQLRSNVRDIFYQLLGESKEFKAFFKFLAFNAEHIDVEGLIRQEFKNEICEHANLKALIAEHPIELAYSLSLIHSFIQKQETDSITPPWVLNNFSHVERIMTLLRSNPCLPGCSYCDKALDAHKALKSFFGYDAYRTFGGEPLQELAVEAAIRNKSLLAIFPTGGGKSLAFQIPALLSGKNSNALTVVISPLQSLMKDQVDNLEKAGITNAVTINGLLDPIERAKSFERTENGSANILYISPESLRSKTIERLILERKIARFVIDEAHCFSAWGQDFRVDYLYIGDFIKSIQEKKNLEEAIPVSCFTATAKQQVIEDIRDYFKEKLSLHLELFTSDASRTNLQYKVLKKEDDEAKYQTVRDLIEEKNCPTIIYVSRTRRAYKLAERLTEDGFNAKPYHGKMDTIEKSANQDAFLSGEVQVMVATSAFGMGVDKKDVGMVLHYDISDSLENYIQEAGRAGRDENIVADCFVLFNEEDLSKHFILLNQTRLSIKEIQQIWRAIKEITRFRSTVSNSALEIARKAGWDDNVVEIETRVITAIAALEDAGYLKRGQNMPRIFANSILSRNAQEAIDKIRKSTIFDEKQKANAVRIIRKLFSSKSKKQESEETGESRIDYISDHLGIVKAEVIEIINLLREENILADTKDLTAFIKKGENRNRSLNILKSFSAIESFLLPHITQEEKIFHIKELNEMAEELGIRDISTYKIKTVFNFWAIKNWIKRKGMESNNHISMIALHSKESLSEKLEKRHALAQFIIEYLYDKSNLNISKNDAGKEEVLVEFSVHELKNAYENSASLFKFEIDLDDIEDTLFYLSRIEAIKIEGGFLVLYNSLTIERTERDNKKRYTKDDYQKLNQFYESKVQQIHIVGEYANMMITDYKNALQFVEDYFQMSYPLFLHKYFKGSRQNEIKRNITPTKFKQLFGELSPTQLKIINDNETRHIVVAAGPGSGKTRVLVHKLASLLLMEDVKHEQLLMLTFSRAAATEFKKRLLHLIGNTANYIEIKTFHSYCFDLLGRVGSLEKSDKIITNTIERIKNGDVEVSRITKTVLVIDEAQDMDADEFRLVKTLMEQNEEMRVIAVGDDDQNIYEFRGSDSKYLEKFVSSDNSVMHELVENYRSKSNLVEYSNQFVKQISKRLKHTPIIAKQHDDGMIKVVRHQSNHLIYPLVQNILSDRLSGTTSVLTRTNEEASQVTGLLLKNNIPAKLIQSNDGFSLYNLDEVRFFIDALQLSDDIYTISDEKWLQAKRSMYARYRDSRNMDVFIQIIKDFEATNTGTRYKSDFEVFIRESGLEDFFSDKTETISVSTMHKAKGKEFDNVFLMLDKFNPTSDADRRLLYVAMTRAKNKLSFHLNESYLDHLKADNLFRSEDQEIYAPPKELAMHLSLKDIWLDYFERRQQLISELTAGDKLIVTEEGCLDKNRRGVLRFSRKFKEEIENRKQNGYLLKSAKVNFIVYWKGEERVEEIKIVLPELIFEKEDDVESVNN